MKAGKMRDLEPGVVQETVEQEGLMAVIKVMQIKGEMIWSLKWGMRFISR